MYVRVYRFWLTFNNPNTLIVVNHGRWAKHGSDNLQLYIFTVTDDETLVWCTGTNHDGSFHGTWPSDPSSGSLRRP